MSAHIIFGLTCHPFLCSPLYTMAQQENGTFIRRKFVAFCDLFSMSNYCNSNGTNTNRTPSDTLKIDFGQEVAKKTSTMCFCFVISHEFCNGPNYLFANFFDEFFLCVNKLFIEKPHLHNILKFLTFFFDNSLNFHTFPTFSDRFENVNEHFKIHEWWIWKSNGN